MQKKRILLVILDGAADRPIMQLGNKTPYETAKTPYLDFLAKYGKTGIMYPIKRIAPESDQAMLAMLGYNLEKIYTGRGVLDAYGAGIPPRGITFRANIVKAKGNIIIDVQGIAPAQGRRHPEKLKKVVNLINKNVKLDCKFLFKPTIGHRAALILLGKNLSDKISNTHPGYKIIEGKLTKAVPRPKGKILKFKKCKPLDKSKAAKRTAEIVNDFIEKTRIVLKKYKLGVVTRGAGSKLPRLKKLKGKWVVLSDMPVEIAIGNLIGMNVKPMPRNLKKVEKAVAKYIKKNNVYLQIKGPDEWAHRGNFIKKKKAIESIDKDFLGNLLKHINLENTIICVTSDHTTACEIKTHSADPVPILIFGKGRDKVAKFDEKACRKGSLGKFEGKFLLKKIEDC